MTKKTEEKMFNYIFWKLRVFDELDFMCHYANKEEYSEMYKECKNPEEIGESKIFEKVLQRVLQENLDYEMEEALYD